METLGNIIDFVKLFQGTFGTKPYVIPGATNNPKSTEPDFNINPQFESNGQVTTLLGSTIQEKFEGKDIWLPIRLKNNEVDIMYLPYAVIRISGKKHLVKTPMVERKGTVKEQYSIEDYEITIKGFLIGDNNQFPENYMKQLKDAYELNTAVTIDNAISNIFLTDKQLDTSEQRRVVITEIDFPEVSGGRKNVRPFVMQMESDTVFTLELE